MAKNGSGKVLSFTSAATTVVGTVTSCHPFGANPGVEMASPLASTLAEVCRVQPEFRVSLFSAGWVAGAAVFCCAERNGTKRNEARTKEIPAHRLPLLIVLLINAVRACIGFGLRHP